MPSRVAESLWQDALLARLHGRDEDRTAAFEKIAASEARWRNDAAFTSPTYDATEEGTNVPVVYTTAVGGKHTGLPRRRPAARLRRRRCTPLSATARSTAEGSVAPLLASAVEVGGSVSRKETIMNNVDTRTSTRLRQWAGRPARGPGGGRTGAARLRRPVREPSVAMGSPRSSSGQGDLIPQGCRVAAEDCGLDRQRWHSRCDRLGAGRPRLTRSRRGSGTRYRRGGRQPTPNTGH